MLAREAPHTFFLNHSHDDNLRNTKFEPSIFDGSLQPGNPWSICQSATSRRPAATMAFFPQGPLHFGCSGLVSRPPGHVCSMRTTMSTPIASTSIPRPRASHVTQLPAHARLLRTLPTPSMACPNTMSCRTCFTTPPTLGCLHHAASELMQYRR